MTEVDVFEEWTNYAKEKKLLDRDIDLNSLLENADNKIVAITGLRRTGKSSILMLLTQSLLNDGKKACYVNLEDSRIKNNTDLLDDILKWFGDEGYMILDEVTNASDWDGWLARNHELLKGKLRLIISSSRKTISRPVKSLRGRILTYEIFPLSFREFLHFKGTKMEKTTAAKGKIERDFEEYLKFGGFPEIALTVNQTDKVRILDSYFHDIIGLDVAEMSGQNVTLVEMFSKYVIQTTYFSASKCLNFLKTIGFNVGKEKILELEKYSESSYIFNFMTVFSRNIKDRSQYPRKALAGDSGFYYANTSRTDTGKLYENVVSLELRRMLSEDERLHYWKNKSGDECDFVLLKGLHADKIVQVVYDLNSLNILREKRGILKCAVELNPNSTLIINRNIKKVEVENGIRIEYMPIVDWLLNNTK
jgi:hypothetical protein